MNPRDTFVRCARPGWKLVPLLAANRHLLRHQALRLVMPMPQQGWRATLWVRWREKEMRPTVRRLVSLSRLSWRVCSPIPFLLWRGHSRKRLFSVERWFITDGYLVHLYGELFMIKKDFPLIFASTCRIDGLLDVGGFCDTSKSFCSVLCRVRGLICWLTGMVGGVMLPGF